MDRRAAIGRGFEILAERRAQRLFEAWLDAQRVEQRRPQRIGSRLQRRGNAGLLGAQLGERRIVLLQQLGGGGMARLGRLPLGRARALHLDALGFGTSDRRTGRVGFVALGLAGALDRLLAPAARLFAEAAAGGLKRCLDIGKRRQLDQLVLDLMLLGGDLLAAHLEPAQALLQLGDLTATRSRAAASSAAIWRVSRSCSPSASTVAACAVSRACRAAAARSSSPTRSSSSRARWPSRSAIAVSASPLRPRSRARSAFGLLQPGLGLLLRLRHALGFGGQSIMRRRAGAAGRRRRRPLRCATAAARSPLRPAPSWRGRPAA